jgi:competence protein ComEC
VIFFKPVYNWFYLENKALDALWKLIAVTLAAQVLTTPVSLYYFHQFPLLFLFTNVLAVPLSSAILIGEILLCVFCFIPPVASAIGWATTLAIRLMNAYIQHLEGLSFSVWQGISISAIQALFLLLFIAGLSYWLLEKKRTGLWLSLTSLFFFMTIRTFSIIHAAQQQQLVVYNIAKHQAIDLFSGQQGWFIGDAALQQNDPAVRLHLQPSRTAYRINRITPFYAKAFTFCNKKILVLDTTVSFQTFSKPHVDLLILSKNLNININEVLTQLAVAQIVIDASVPAWKAAQWQQACNAQHIPCYNVAQKGAFEMRVPHPTFAAL